MVQWVVGSNKQDMVQWVVGTHKQDMVQWVVGYYKHCGPITGRGFLDSYVTVNFSRGFYSMDFINDWTLTTNLTL